MARRPFCYPIWQRSRTRTARVSRRPAPVACLRDIAGRATRGMIAVTILTWATSSQTTKETGAEEASRALGIPMNDPKKEDQGHLLTSCTGLRQPEARTRRGVARALDLGQAVASWREEALSLGRGRSPHPSRSSPSISLRRCGGTSRSIVLPAGRLFRVLARATPSGSKCCSSSPRG